MKKLIVANIVMNLSVSAIYIYCTNTVLKLQYEETFIVLAVAYGLTVTLTNAIFLGFISRK